MGNSPTLYKYDWVNLPIRNKSVDWDECYVMTINLPSDFKNYVDRVVKLMMFL